MLNQVLNPPFVRIALTVFWRNARVSFRKPTSRKKFPYDVPCVSMSASGRAEALGIDDVRHLFSRMASLAQLREADDETIVVTELFIATKWANDLVLADEATCPMDRHVNDFAVSVNVDHDSFDKMSNDGLSIGVCGGRGVPESRDVRSKRHDG